MAREWTIGPSTFRFESPDVLWVKNIGTCSREQAVAIVNLYRELAMDRSFFLLTDMKEARGPDPEARRYTSENLRSEWFLGIILYNTRLLHRAFASGLVLAAAMTRSLEDPPRAKLHFVSTQDKALTLLAQLRSQTGPPRA